jgi:hypothetical protein
LGGVLLMPTDAHGNEFGWIRYAATNPDGSLASSGSTTSMDPGYELEIMSRYLEAERASRLRGVKFGPHAIGGLVVCAADVPLLQLLRGWLKERRRALVNRKEQAK